MRASACFDTDEAWRLPLEKSQYFPSTQSSIEDRSAIGVSAVNLKNLFSQIQSYRGNLLHGTAPVRVAFDNDHS
jgi:hypothetical protein